VSRRDVLREAFNTPDEVHAFVHGLFRSLVHPDPRRPQPRRSSSKNEPHYWQAGWLMGDVVHLLGVILLGGRASGLW
jgi:hypothetical protein